MPVNSEKGFVSVLNNRHFMRLWMAETIGLASQNGIHFVQMVLIERLTGSTTQMGLMILAFSIPGVLFSAIAGVIVDRLSKKFVLNASNILRVLSVASYVIVLRYLHGWQVLLALYAVTFILSSIGQFFGPALWAKVPLVIGEDKLLAANTLFNLTSVISQVAGLMVIVPLLVKLVGVEGSFIAIALSYVVATVLVSLLPGDRPERRPATTQASPLSSAWSEIREGWQFIGSHRGIYMPMAQLTLIATLIMVLAMLAPGFSARVLGMAPEDAVFIFAPAGLGMFLSTVALGRFGSRFKRETWINVSLAGTAAGFAALGTVSRGHIALRIPLFEAYPEATISITTAVMGIALFTGFFMATANAVAQTCLQERSPASIRGRVYAVQFLLANLVSIPPLLGLGTVADYLGIPIVCFILTGSVLVMWVASVINAIRLHRAEAEALYDDEVAADRAAGRRRILIIAPMNEDGTRRAAEALAQALRGRDKIEPRVHIVDGLSILPATFHTLAQLWRALASREQRLRQLVEQLLRSPFIKERVRALACFLMRPAAKHALSCYRPDVVITMQPLFGHLLAYAVQGERKRRPVITVITDLINIHPLWVCPHVELCIAPSQASEERVLADGMPRERVKQAGLPISLQFNAGLPDKQVLRRKLSWPLRRPTILLVSGARSSTRFFQIGRAIASSRPDAHLAIVTGQNERLRARLEQSNWEISTSIYGPVENLPELMQAADLIVTHADSIIIAEALAAGLPMVLVEQPGQEAANVAYVVGAGAGVCAGDPARIAAIIHEWLRPDNPALAYMSSQALRLARPQAAREIAELIMELVQAGDTEPGT